MLSTNTYENEKEHGKEHGNYTKQYNMVSTQNNITW